MSALGAKKISSFIIGLSFTFLILFAVYNYLVKTRNEKKIDLNLKITPSVAIIPTDSVKIGPLELSKTDDNWGKKAKEINQNYPWLQKLPLQTDEYFVYFDINKNLFVAKIFNKDQVEKIRQEIFTSLSYLEINYANYQFQWQLK